MSLDSKTLESFESSDGLFCIDVFRRADGSFGFEEFRRDFEDSRGWFPIGGYSKLVFLKKEEAFAAAFNKVKWFSLLS